MPTAENTSRSCPVGSAGQGSLCGLLGKFDSETASVSSTSPQVSLLIDDMAEKLSSELGVSTPLSMSEGLKDNDGAEEEPGTSTPSSSASLGVEDRMVCPF